MADDIAIRAGDAAAAVATLDFFAEADRRGPNYVSGALREDIEAWENRVSPYVEALAASAVGALLVAKLNGVKLDPDDPFSDASLSGALSQVLGVPVPTVRDKVELRKAFMAATTRQISTELGTPFLNINDLAQTRRDVLRAVGAQATYVVPGLELRDLSSREQTLADLELYATRKISDVVGIPLTNLRSIRQIKADVYAWALQLIDAELGEGAGPPPTKPLRMDRKGVRNREAQRRFRAKWGNREKYIPIDMDKYSPLEDE